MSRLQTALLIPIALTTVGFALNTSPAIAYRTYKFSASYDLTNGGRFLSPNGELAEVIVSGDSTNAVYGLNKLNGLTYVQTDPTTGNFTANTDPTTFGLQNLPSGFFVIESSNGDKLIGTESSNGVTDFNTLEVNNSGTINITGGEGRFKGFTGTLSFIEVGKQSTDPNIPYKGTLTVTGSLRKVSEHRTDVGILFSMGIVGIGALLSQRNHSLLQRFTHPKNPVSPE